MSRVSFCKRLTIYQILLETEQFRSYNDIQLVSSLTPGGAQAYLVRISGSTLWESWLATCTVFVHCMSVSGLKRLEDGRGEQLSSRLPSEKVQVRQREEKVQDGERERGRTQ